MTDINEPSLIERAREVHDRMTQPGVDYSVRGPDEAVEISVRDLRTLFEAAMWWEDAAVETVYRADMLRSTDISPKTFEDAESLGHAASELWNAVFSLKTFLPGFDSNSGTMPWERDEEG